MHQMPKMTPAFAAVYTSVFPCKLHGCYCAQHSSRTSGVPVSGECVCAHTASPVLVLSPSPPQVFRELPWVCLYVCHAHLSACAHSRTGREDVKSGYKITSRRDPVLGLQYPWSPKPFLHLQNSRATKKNQTQVL